MTFTIDIPTLNGQEEIKIEAGSSMIFVGANGTGKTRLAAYIEEALGLDAHRISAHRALSLNPTVSKISESKALMGLRVGYEGDGAQIIHRQGSRWSDKGSVHLLNDFDFLVQALFADQANKSLQTHKEVRSGNTSDAKPTKFEILVEIWERLLPHRKLHISGDDIQVSVAGENEYYSGSEMSDGERAVFYMLGQTLVAAEDSLMIFDEPELHVHRSIMANLWDELESVRPDCAFLFITHDLEFASSRIADKYVLRQYNSNNLNPYWIIEKIPNDSGFDEELTTLILGSRKPILFVEGTQDSLDIALYRSCFTDWTIVPKGSCKDVIHSVVTMRENDSLTRITCSGIVDADSHNKDERDHLQRLGIATLPVSEIENLILLPSISRIIVQNEGYTGDEVDTKLNNLASEIFEYLNSDGVIEEAVIKHCKRRIDSLLKKIDFSEADTVAELENIYKQKTDALNIESIAQEATDNIRRAIDNKDLPLLLSNYDKKNKLLSIAAKHFKNCRLKDFKSWIVRVLRNDSVEGLTQSIKEILPDITPR